VRAAVVYESMYGNTHLIADAIASGLGHSLDVEVFPVGEADATKVHDVDLLVVGGPTHVHGMTRPSTRQAAVEALEKDASGLTLEPGATETGIREWLETLAELDVPAAAFDTRVDMPAVITGRASKGIDRELRKHGCTMIAEPESFLVTKDSHLEPDEETHARRWGATLAATFAAYKKAGVR
jgi:hypothetical protein